MRTYLSNRAMVASYNRGLKERAAGLIGKRHKFGGTKPGWIDGYYFQSNAEAHRYRDLVLLRKAGKIKALMVHPSADIVINEVKICRVVCDFSYWDCDQNKTIVEDVKKERIGRDGKVKFTTNTDLSKIKQKLMLAVLGIKVVIVKYGEHGR